MPHTSSYSGSAKSASDARNRPTVNSTGNQMDTLQVPTQQRNQQMPAEALIAALENMIEIESGQGDQNSVNNDSGRMPKINSVSRLISDLAQSGGYKPTIKRETSVTEMFKKPEQSWKNIVAPKHDEELKPSLKIGISAGAVSDFSPNNCDRMGKLNSFNRRIDEETPGFNAYSHPESPKSTV